MRSDRSRREHNKKVVTELYEHVYLRRDFSKLDELVAADFVNHDLNGNQSPGPAGIRFVVGLFHDCYKDFRLNIQEIIAEGDTVAARVMLEGIQVKDLFDAPATGQLVRTQTVAFWHLRDGRIVGLHAVRRLSSGYIH